MQKTKTHILPVAVLLLICLAYGFLYDIWLAGYEARYYQSIYTTLYIWLVRPLACCLAAYLLGVLLLFKFPKSISRLAVQLCTGAAMLFCLLYIMILCGFLPYPATFFILTHPALFAIPGICIAVRTGGSQDV